MKNSLFSITKAIEVTPLVKRKVKEMLKQLISEVNYVRVKKSGIVVLKKKWYSCKRVKTDITNICLSEIPKLLAKSAHEKNMGDQYEKVFNEHISNLMSLKFYSPNFEIVNYLWSNFLNIHLQVPVVLTITERSGLVPQHTSNYMSYMLGALKILKNDKYVRSKLENKILEIMSKNSLSHFKLRLTT